MSVHASGGSGPNGVVLARIPLPGHPIVDGLGEGKPEQQGHVGPFVRGRVIELLDMNSDVYFCESLKLPNALSTLGLVAGPMADSGRPLVLLGLREHVYTSVLSTPALLMSQQETLFGVLMQRIMAQPLFVRLCYGHPDLADKLFMNLRCGGLSKASSVINVSEDIFAGFTTLARGGESGHALYLQTGKGRDVGILQVAVFEAKISAGTALSFTSRDSLRMYDLVDGPRLASLWHSGAGYYVSCVLVVLAFVSNLYYQAALALSGLDTALLSSQSVFLLGTVTVVQWALQLGILTLFPLWILHVAEAGVVAAVTRVLRSILVLGPLFYMLEVQTKAYWFDAGLATGKSSYAATGRDFVLRHVPLDETWRGVATSHLYLGVEGLLLLVLITLTGRFPSPSAYLFFTTAAWLFTSSLLLAPFWFNPFAFELSSVLQDGTTWFRWWARAPGAPGSTPESSHSWSAWYSKEFVAQYAQASPVTRGWRLLRLSRLLLLAALLVTHGPSAAGREVGMLIFYASVVGGVLVALQVVAAVTSYRGSGQPATNSRSMLAGAVVLAALVGGPLLAGGGAALSWEEMVTRGLGMAVALWWAGRAVCILSAWPLYGAARALHASFDAAIAALLLLLFACACVVVPLGSRLHTFLLFSAAYASSTASVTSTRGMLAAVAGKGGRANTFWSTKTLEFRSSSVAPRDVGDGRPENAIGVTRVPLEAVGGEQPPREEEGAGTGLAPPRRPIGEILGGRTVVRLSSASTSVSTTTGANKLGVGASASKQAQVGSSGAKAAVRPRVVRVAVGGGGMVGGLRSRFEVGAAAASVGDEA